MGFWVSLFVLLVSSNSWIADARLDPSLNGDALRNKNMCALCEEFASEALGYLGDNKTQTEIIDVLHESCARALSFKEEVTINLPPRLLKICSFIFVEYKSSCDGEASEPAFLAVADCFKILSGCLPKTCDVRCRCSCKHIVVSLQCITLVDNYAPVFFMEVLSVQPNNFCQKVNLCEKITLLSLQVEEEKCDLCRQVVSEVMEKLKDPDTQMDIIQILLKACNSMESYAKKCKRMVFEYGPLILANAEQFLETRDVCVTMRACRSSKASQQIVQETSPWHSST